jgi:hypothetical protein
LVVFAGTADAVPVVYSGYDVGSTSLATSPNATAAAAAFDLATGPLSIIDFEPGLPAGVSASGGSIGSASSLCATAALHCYATSPINVQAGNGTTYTFASAIDALGTFFTGWQITGQTLTPGYSDGTTTVLGMPAGNNAGGTLFFGFIDVGALITSIAYFAGSTSADYAGLDDVRYGNAAPIPIPASLWLLVAGLIGLMGIARRKKAA